MALQTLKLLEMAKMERFTRPARLSSVGGRTTGAEEGQPGVGAQLIALTSSDEDCSTQALR